MMLAGEWLDGKLKEVAALKRGDMSTIRRQTMLTLRELVDEYLEQHSAEQNTLRTLRARLRYAVDTFGDTRVDRLDPQGDRGVAEAAAGTLRLGDPQDVAAGAPLRRPGEAAGRERGDVGCLTRSRSGVRC